MDSGRTIADTLWIITDLKTKHNSNHKTLQITLEGEIVQEYTYYVLGFVPAHVIRLKENSWFCKLDRDQIVGVEDYMSHKEKF